ncbi:eclosion hormone-like [Anopheles aquasalis]|uniref:eclosion hormone-like n=1 Tax=Anopheles aquasalis TaxID=42839 RepID=UPI00215B4A4C|nr:eclosion hormone-like [Anopheles aquasalis]
MAMAMAAETLGSGDLNVRADEKRESDTLKMFAAKLLLVASLIAIGTSVTATPQIDILGGYELFGLCVNNCAQCKKLYGEYFEGQRCAESCIKYRGKTIPDCEDTAYIAPFLNTLLSPKSVF